MAVSSARHLEGSPAYQLALNQPNVQIQGSSPLRSSPVPSGWTSIPEDRWTSEARFAADAAAGAIPTYVKAVLYDNEDWAQTPLNERRQPGLFMKMFCQLAHQHGWLCATAPARDICSVAYPDFHGSLSDCFITNNLAGQAAKYANYTELQSQVLELQGTMVYAKFVSTTAAQAKAANPAIVILGGLSPTPYGMPVSAVTLNEDARAVFPSSVRGFYMTITSGGASSAAQFFALFEPAGPSSAPRR